MPYRVEIGARASDDLDRIFAAINAENSRLQRAGSTAFTNHCAPCQRCLNALPSSLRAVCSATFSTEPSPTSTAIYSVDEQHSRVVIHTIRHGAQAPYQS